MREHCCAQLGGAVRNPAREVLCATRRHGRTGRAGNGPMEQAGLGRAERPPVDGTAEGPRCPREGRALHFTQVGRTAWAGLRVCHGHGAGGLVGLSLSQVAGQLPRRARG